MKFILYITICLISTLSRAQSAITLPCEMAQNLCLLKGSFNNLSNLWLALDTGSSFSVIDSSLVPSLQALQSGTEQSGGAGKGGVNEAAVFDQVEIGVGPIKLASQKILSLPIQYTSVGIGHRVDGFLGWNIFDSFVVTIDYPNKSVTFAPFGTPMPEKLENIPFEIGDDNIPVIVCELVATTGEVIKGKFLVDIGQLGKDVVIAEPFRLAHPELLNGLSVQHSKVEAVGGVINFDLSHVPQLNFGSTIIHSASAAYPIDPVGVYARSDIAGAIGVTAFKNRRVTFDYQRRRIFLSLPIEN